MELNHMEHGDVVEQPADRGEAETAWEDYDDDERANLAILEWAWRSEQCNMEAGGCPPL